MIYRFNFLLKRKVRAPKGYSAR